MDIRDFGTTGLHVSALGYGAGHIGGPAITEQDAKRLIDAVLDAGITLIDTARGYGLSEQRIGRYLGKRRSDVVLSTKVGYGIEGFDDWTGPCVRAGIDQALRDLNTDWIDIVHLHSCDIETLHGDVVTVLEEARRAGKIRVAAYSGENEAMREAMSMDRFDSLQVSVNVCDQRFMDRSLWNAKQRGMGVIAKRPVANAPWRFTERPLGHYCEVYWTRWKTMKLDEFDIDPHELALRFAAYTWGVDCCIVGTTRVEHLLANVKAVEKGKLPGTLVNDIRARFRHADNGWDGQL